MEAIGKLRFSKLGLNFNTDFQKLHLFQLKKNHWRNFLIYLSLGMTPNPDCDSCENTMMRASLTLQEVKELVPGEAVQHKQMRLSKPPEPGVIRGRPKRGVQSSISIWQ